jgi:hypothetical protein
MKTVTKTDGKVCTKCIKKFLYNDIFCTNHGDTLDRAFITHEDIAWTDKLDSDEGEDDRLLDINYWLPDRKDKSHIYIANDSYTGSFDYSFLDGDNGGVLPLDSVDCQKCIDAFKTAFDEPIAEIAKIFKTLTFKFGIIQYWA